MERRKETRQKPAEDSSQVEPEVQQAVQDALDAAYTTAEGIFLQEQRRHLGLFRNDSELRWMYFLKKLRGQRPVLQMF